MERVQGTAVPATQQHVKQVTRRSWVAFLLAFLQLGCAVAVICVTRYNLETLYAATTGSTGVWAYVCYLSTDFSAWACQYAYCLGAISLILSIAVFVTQCIAFDEGLSRAPHLFECGLDGFGFIWWLVGAIVFSVEIDRFNQVNVTQPRRPSRNGVLALCWISTGLFMLLFVVNLTTAAKIKKAVHGKDIKPVQPTQEMAQPADAV